ncbi:MAG: alpha/beta hydrolase [Acidobacteriota bacterium]|nr:alpha/beta hydrolase [Acidobacteriota bacterium]
MSQGHIESVSLHGEAGRLEALLNLGAPDAEYAALVCHPHPLFGGTMHNKVVFHAMKAINSFGIPVLRFNFRGVGASAGEHDYGRGEISDVHVALDYLAERFSLPIVFAGFSFGAAVGLRAAVDHRRVEALASLGTPVVADNREYTYALLREARQPKLMLSGGNDQYATPAQLRKIFDEAAEPKKLVILDGADHFFAGHLDEMRDELSAWLRQALPLS